ncbi:MAG: CRISPR-associated protein Csx11 [Firmicutes bacterium]|nr:CRISPR-associated protein Csx11 [Bacillota bacterium]
MNATGKDLAEKLKSSRALLLACETIGWLHQTGKAHPDFLLSQGRAGVKYTPEDWHKQLVPGWSDRLRWVKERTGKNDIEWPASLEDFLYKYNKAGSEDLVGCLQAGHAMASGIEKSNFSDKASEYLKQDATHMWLTSAYGRPMRNLLADPPEVLRSGGWETLLQRIGALLDRLEKLGTERQGDVYEWWKWREDAIGQGGWLRRAFEATVADTRLPNNDVTLWDQSYVAGALFKSAVAGLVLLGKPPNGAWEKLKTKTRWRVLTVGFGTEHYQERAVRIVDWTGAAQQIEAFFEDVRRLIEVELAVGSLVYRDDQVLAFTFPGLRSDDQDPGQKSLGTHAAEELLEWIKNHVDELAQQRLLETPPWCSLSESTRSFIPMANQVAEARKKLTVPLHRPWTISEKDDKEDNKRKRGDVCPVCQVRFNGGAGGKETSPKQRPCRVCGERREKRLKAWLTEGKDTIWISELADDNDRVALLTFRFDLGPWLDGSRTDSLRTQCIAAWRRHNPSVNNNKDNPIDLDDPTESLMQHVRSVVHNPRKVTSVKRAGNLDDAIMASLNQGFSYDQDLSDFYHRMVEDRADAPPRWDAVKHDPGRAAHWLVHQIFRKNPSPGRVYRFWRTAEAFFDELLPVFREAAAAHQNRWRTRRLLLVPDKASQGGWQDHETYATRWNDAPLELLYCAESESFLTICNLARILRPEEQPRERLKGLRLELESDKGDRSTLTIGKVSVPSNLGSYSPLIVLDRRPERFRVLVPLQAAPACIDAALKKWRDEFAPVWDRMPLRFGVVAFSRMTPFQAVIEAARNLEDALSGPAEETWSVMDCQVRNGIAALLLMRRDGTREIVTVPTVLPDGRVDEHYPYVAVTNPRHLRKRDFTVPPSDKRAKQTYRHVLDLTPGDEILVAPSRFATMFLASTADRFHPVDVRYVSEWDRMREIWHLLCRTAPSVTSLHTLWSALADVRARWEDLKPRPSDPPPWASLVRSVLADTLGVRPSELEVLVEAAVFGILEKTLDWHLRILKLEESPS